MPPFLSFFSSLVSKTQLLSPHSVFSNMNFHYEQQQQHSEEEEETTELELSADFAFDFLMDPFSTDSSSQTPSDDNFSCTASPSSFAEPLAFVEGSKATPQGQAINLNTALPPKTPSVAAAATPSTSLASGAGLELKSGSEMGLARLLDLQTRLSQEIFGTPSHLTRAQSQARLLRRKMRGIRRKLDSLCPKKSKKESE